MSESPEVRSDTRTARDLAGAEVALKKAGWKRGGEVVTPNPTLSGRIEEFERDYEAFGRIAEKFAPKPNPVTEFFNTSGGAEAMKQLVPVLMSKLFGAEVVKENPEAGAVADLSERVEAIEELMLKIAKKIGVE